MPNFLVVDICLTKVSTFFSFNVWALCPAGYYLNGLRLGAGPPAYLQHIDEGQCCHPHGHPNSYEHCYDEDVTHSFDHKGWSECQQAGYYMIGFYKSSCNNIYCIEKFRCCKMKKRKFNFTFLNHELAVRLHSNKSFPTLLPVRQPSIYNQYFKTSLLP